MIDLFKVKSGTDNVVMTFADLAGRNIETRCDKQIITWGFWLSPAVSTLDHYQPSSYALGLIMGSRVDTAGDNQKPHVIISNDDLLTTSLG